MRRMAAHFVGEIRMAFDRPVDGIATANAPAALAADATTALEAAFRRPSYVLHSPGTAFNHATRRYRLTPADRTGCVPIAPYQHKEEP